MIAENSVTIENCKLLKQRFNIYVGLIKAKKSVTREILPLMVRTYLKSL